MKKPRDIKKLLELLLDHKKLFSEDTDYCSHGLCWLYHRLYQKDIITAEEFDIVGNYIEKHVPKSKWLANNPSSSYYWARNEWAPRAGYLRRHIKRLTK